MLVNQIKQWWPVSNTPMIRLFLILLVILMVSFIAFSINTWFAVKNQKQNELKAVNKIVSQSILNTLIKHESTLSILGERLIDLGALSKPENGRSLIEHMLVTDPGMGGFGLARLDGQLILVTRLKQGTPLPNLKDDEINRRSFERAIQTKKLRLAPPYYMRALKEWVIPIRVPVSGTNNTLAAMMTAGYKISGSNAGWSDLSLPKQVSLSVIRQDGYVQYKFPITVNYQSVYGHKVPLVLQQQVINASDSDNAFYAKLSDTAEERLFYYSAIPEYEIYTLVSIPMSQIRDYFISRLSMPSLFFLVICVIGIIAFRRIHKNQRQYEDNLIYQATHDALTDLPNRVYLVEYLDEKLELADREESKLAVLFLDLDFFKKINDSFGHAVGDKLLKRVGQRLLTLVSENSLVTRQGGDEFVVIKNRYTELSEIEQLAMIIINALLKPFQIDNKDLLVGTSIGISVYPDDGKDADTLLKNADSALYKAKEDGRCSYAMYSEELYAKVKRRLNIEEALFRALDKKELFVLYQPQARCRGMQGKTIEISGMEALIRWNNEALGMVAPDEFIPIAEDLGLIRDLDNFVMHCAIKDTIDLNKSLGMSFNISINVSAKQLMAKEFPGQVKEVLLQHDFMPNLLTVELTETALLNEFEYAIKQLHKIRELGVGVAIDDFGTGYSSLSYLHKLPATEIKVDRSFVRDILIDRHDAVLTRSIIQMGQGLNLHVVAEGVESEDHLIQLKEYGCDYIQGYWLSKPIDIEQLKSFVLNQGP